jgi:Uma2 family endonuclease
MQPTASIPEPAAKPRHTYEDYAALPEGAPYQLVEGDLLMTPSPVAGHQRLSRDICRLLDDWARKTDAGEVIPAPFDVILDDANVLQPDVLFVSRERLHIIQDWCRGAPDLVVEVLSPSNAALDRSRKTKVYARFGVKRVWLVDPAEKSFECLLLDGATYRIEAAFAEDDAVELADFPGLKVPLPQLWPAPPDLQTGER